MNCQLTTVAPTTAPTAAPTLHQCDDGTHGCDTGPGGICYEYVYKMGLHWACGCAAGFYCSHGCTMPHSGHECVALTANPTKVPTKVPTNAPTKVPTNAPTLAPDLTMYMYDTYGDGWNSNYWTWSDGTTSSTGTLSSGSSGTMELCGDCSYTISSDFALHTRYPI